MKRTTSNKRARRGFTLVEMSIVVVIVGILGVVATVAYRRYVTSSKIAEGTNMVGAIRQAQENYKAEIGKYADVSVSTTSFYPDGVGPGKKVAWGAPCTNCNTPTGATAMLSWSALNVQPDAPVMFGYMTRAYTTVTPTTALGGIYHKNVLIGGLLDQGYTNRPGPWYIVRAVTNPASPTTCTQVLGNSFDNEILVDDATDN